MARTHANPSARHGLARLGLPQLILQIYGIISALFGDWLGQMASPECALDLTYISRWMIRAGGPLALILPFVFLLCTCLRVRAAKAIVMLASIMLIYALRTAMEPFACTNVGEKTAIRAAPEISCSVDNTDYLLLVGVGAVLFLVFGVGFTALMIRTARTDPNSWLVRRFRPELPHYEQTVNMQKFAAGLSAHQ